MNCHHSRLLLAFRPDELAGDDRAALDAHLQTCPTCSAAAKNGTAADAAIRKAMLAVPVPSGLQAKLHAAVSTKQSAVWRRKAGWIGAALAASVLVATTIWAGLYLSRPTLGSDEMVVLLDRERLMKEQAVGEWLRSEGLPADLPRPFEYGYHAFHGTQPLKGMKVPSVVFHNGQHQCRVYIIRKGDVRTPTDGWKDATGSEFNITTVEENGLVYVIAYTSPTLDPFLQPARPVA